MRHFPIATLLQKLGDQARPAGLMARSYSGSIVAVELFIEQHQVAPMWIFAVMVLSAMDGSRVLIVAQEYSCEPSRKLGCHFPKRHELARAGWALHFEVIP